MGETGEEVLWRKWSLFARKSRRRKTRSRRQRLRFRPKTMLRQLISKWGIMSIDLQTAVDKDMAVIREDGTAEYVENETETEDAVVADQELNEVPEEQPEEKTGPSVEDEFFNN